MKVTIVGTRRREYKGKDGRDRVGFDYYGLKDFTNYDIENAECEGNCVVHEFSSRDYGVHVGDLVSFEYEPGFDGRATLCDVALLKAAGASGGDGKAK